MNRDLLRDLSAALAAALLVTTAAVVGTFLEHRYGNLHVSWPPLYGHWEPHLGPGTPAAILVAVAVVAYGPSLAARLPWRALLWSAWGTAMAWTFSLALVDGWQRGIALRLTTKYEYLQVINPVNRFHDIPAALRDFTHHIVIHSPDAWPAHVAGHPPAATLTFVLLDRIGLGGGAWAGVWCITVGATAAAAVLVTVRALCGEQLARRAAPFLVLAPAAVWMGTSADGYFTAVAAWAVAFLALAVTGHRPRSAGLASGLLFGLVVYLSYGLTLFAVIAGGVLLLGSRRLKPLPYVIAGFVVLPAVFTFWASTGGRRTACWSPATTKGPAVFVRTGTGCGRTSRARCSSWVRRRWPGCAAPVRLPSARVFAGACAAPTANPVSPCSSAPPCSRFSPPTSPA